MSSFSWPPSGGGGGGTGTVTSVDVSGGSTGLTTSGGPVTTSGTITVAGTLNVGHGGSGTATAFTAGSVVYAGASGVYSQDNANFFWDAADHRLGIGNASPVAPLDVKRDANGYSYNCQINNGDYFMLVNVGTGNQQGFTAVGGVRWDWLPGGASAFQMNDTGAGAVQLLPRHSRDLQLVPDGTTNTNNIKIGSSGSQTALIAEFQSAAGTTVASVGQTGAVTLGATSATPTHVINSAHTTGSGSGTLTNVPGSAGNPAGYLTVTINGTTSYIPYFQ